MVTRNDYGDFIYSGSIISTKICGRVCDNTNCEVAGGCVTYDFERVVEELFVSICVEKYALKRCHCVTIDVDIVVVTHAVVKCVIGIVKIKLSVSRI